MKQIYPDLWQTKPEHPFTDVPELTTRACFLARSEGNVLFYSTADPSELQHIQELGGITHQYLAHYHEAGPHVARIKQRFGSVLCCHALEEKAVSEAAGVPVDVTFQQRETHQGNLEIIPTPGHTPGSVCYLYQSPRGKRYLFTGDTIWIRNDATWQNGFLPGESSKSKLIESIETLRPLEPDVVIPPSSNGERCAFREIAPGEWQSVVDEVIRQLS